MAILFTPELQPENGHQGVLLVHFKNFCSPNLPKIFVYPALGQVDLLRD